MMLNMMEQYPIAEYGFQSTKAMHVMIEAKKLAYAGHASLRRRSQGLEGADRRDAEPGQCEAACRAHQSGEGGVYGRAVEVQRPDGRKRRRHDLPLP
jgi:hypothetical protein